MQEDQILLIRRIVIYATIVLVVLAILVTIYRRFDQARLSISAPDNYSVSISRSPSLENLESLGQGNQSYSSSDPGPAYIVAESDSGIFYGYTELINRQESTITVTPNQNSFSVQARRVGAPVAHGYIEDNILYGVSEKTNSVAVNLLEDSGDERFFFGYPAVRHIDWINRDNFVFETVNGEAGFSYRGRSGSYDIQISPDYANVSLGPGGELLMFQNSRIVFLSDYTLAYTPPDPVFVDGSILEADIYDEMIVALVLDQDEHYLLEIEPTTGNEISRTRLTLPEGVQRESSVGLSVSADGHIVAFASGAFKIEGDAVEKLFLPAGLIQDLAVVNGSAFALMDSGLFKLVPDGFQRVALLVENTIGTSHSIFSDESSIYFSSQGAEDNYLHNISLSSLE